MSSTWVRPTSAARRSTVGGHSLSPFSPRKSRNRSAAAGRAQFHPATATEAARTVPAGSRSWRGSFETYTSPAVLGIPNTKTILAPLALAPGGARDSTPRPLRRLLVYLCRLTKISPRMCDMRDTNHSVGTCRTSFLFYQNITRFGDALYGKALFQQDNLPRINGLLLAVLAIQ